MSRSSPAVAASAASQSTAPATGAAAPLLVYPTAFLEGAAVIIIEIAGARALAPYFGTSLQVWTATITVTLFFLAVGYGLGGLLARRLSGWMLPALFATAGLWTALYPLLRTPVLDFASTRFGVAIGSLVAASVLFGLPLMLLGAVSPVLIAYIDRRRPGAGSAAGRLFFTNTMGGLVGGWVVAFALIPHTSLRLSLVVTGVGLIVLGVLWAFITRARTFGVGVAVPMLLIGGYVLLFNRPQRVFRDRHGIPFELLYSRQSGIGLLQVLDYDDPRHKGRMLLINGVLQGQMDQGTGRAGLNPYSVDYIHNLHLVSHSHHPEAKSALQLGLGAGLMPKELARRGVKVRAIEIEPRIAQLAREKFNLPQSVDVRISDARTFLRADPDKYDLILLDTFASESTAWYLLTKEAFAEMRARLNPGGRLVINTVAYASPDRPGILGIETTLASLFPQVLLYPETGGTTDPEELINVTIVAGENLRAQMVLPDEAYRMPMLARLIANERAARTSGRVDTDDHSDLDYAQAPLRIRWRSLIWGAMNSSTLWD